MILGENMKTIRKRWGENQDDFAHRFGMKRSNLSKVERGEFDLSLQNAKLLSDLTGISMNRLMDELLALEDIPALPIGEGGEILLKVKDPAAPEYEKSNPLLIAILSSLEEIQMQLEKQKKENALLQERLKKLEDQVNKASMKPF